MHYQRILIIGKNSPVSDIVLQQFKKPGHIVIGSKGKGPSASEYMSLLGLIGEDTRIDIVAHGMELNGKHYIETDKPIPTRDLLTILNGLGSNSKLNVHLWSCYAGLASKDASTMTVGSTLITHASSADIAIFAMINAELQKTSSSQNPFLDFARDMLSSSVGTSKFTFAMSKSEVKTFEVAPNFEELIQNPLKALMNVQSDFITFAKGHNINVLPSKYSSKEVTEFLEGYLVCEYSLGNKHAVEYINSGSALKDKIDFTTFKKIIPLDVVVEKSNIDFVKLALAIGSDVNIQEAYGQSPLQISVVKGNLEIAELLLAKKPELETRYNGHTPLHFSILKGDLEMTELLIKNGANINAITNSGATGLYLAIGLGNNKLIKLLLENNASLHTEIYSDADAFYMNIHELYQGFLSLVGFGDTGIEKLSIKSISALTSAACEGYTDSVKLILEYHHSKEVIIEHVNIINDMCPEYIDTFKLLVKGVLAEHQNDEL